MLQINKFKNKKSAYAVYEKVLTRVSQVGAAEQRKSDFPKKISDLAYSCKQPLPKKNLVD